MTKQVNGALLEAPEIRADMRMLDVKIGPGYVPGKAGTDQSKPSRSKRGAQLVAGSTMSP